MGKKEGSSAASQADGIAAGKAKEETDTVKVGAVHMNEEAVLPKKGLSSSSRSGASPSSRATTPSNTVLFVGQSKSAKSADHAAPASSSATGKGQSATAKRHAKHVLRSSPAVDDRQSTNPRVLIVGVGATDSNGSAARGNKYGLSGRKRKNTTDSDAVTDNLVVSGTTSVAAEDGVDIEGAANASAEGGSSSDLVNGEVNDEVQGDQGEADEESIHVEGELAVANLVPDEEVGNEQLPRAEEWGEEKRPKDRRAWYPWLVVGGIILLGIILALVFLVDGNGNLADGSPTSAPTLSASGFVLSLLPDETVDAIVGNPNSNQSRTLEWMIQDLSLPLYPDWRILQRFALATLFYSTGGGVEGRRGWRKTTDWLSYDVHECQWFHHENSGLYEKPFKRQNLLYNPKGGICNGTDIYHHLWLPPNRLRGPFPNEVYLLTSLRSISIIQNKVSGTITTEIAKLSQLEVLALLQNEFSGPVPSHIGLLNNLRGLPISYNSLSGSIPSEIGFLSNSLEFLIIDSCEFNGTVPTQIGLLSELRWLFMSQNFNMTGPYPAELANMDALEDLRMDGNNLGGTIPTELARMKSIKQLSFMENRVSGPIPTEFGLTSTLSLLWLKRNSLSGTLPSQLGLLTGMLNLTIEETQLSGSIPSQIGLLTNIETLLLPRNKFVNKLPSEVAFLTGLREFDVSGNNFSGSLLPPFCDIQELKFDCSRVGLCGCDCPCS